uniref:Uncharacterized protein n=1 Tax=Meloidogyne enterolobii TaxID=390850 RepID=A0A6V7WUZ3_MELEN|nr:unnamed protein product [Meloidogyne enterolobii]
MFYKIPHTDLFFLKFLQNSKVLPLFYLKMHVKDLFGNTINRIARIIFMFCMVVWKIPPNYHLSNKSSIHY